MNKEPVEKNKHFRKRIRSVQMKITKVRVLKD